MIFNSQAKELFGEPDIFAFEENSEYPISRKYDRFGRDYYSVSHFWNMDENISEETDLSIMEWDGNDIHLSFTEKGALGSEFNRAIGIVKSWKKQLEKYSDSKFYIIMSYDNGDLLDEEDREYSFTLRFWKERSGSSLITPSVNEFEQPVIIEQCN